MPTTKRRRPSACIQWISSKEMAKIVDSRSRSVLNISGKAFIRNRKNGKYAKLDADDCPGIVELALLAPAVKGTGSIARKKSSGSR
jgi:hypothetical protein